MEAPAPRNRAERRGKGGRPPGSLNRNNPRHPQFLSLRSAPKQLTGISESGPDVAEELTPPDAQMPADKPPKERKVGAGRPRKQAIGAQIVEGFTGLYLLGSAFVAPFNGYDAEVIMRKSHDMAVALEQVARHNVEFYRVLARIAVANDYTAVLMSYGAVVYAIAANHGAVPARPVAMFDLPLPPERAGVGPMGPSYEPPLPPHTPFYDPSEQAIPMGPAFNGPVASEMPDTIALAVQRELAGREGLVEPGGHDAMIARIREESLRQLAALQAGAARQGAEGMPTVNPRGGV